MLFHTRYGTKVTILSEPIARDCIEYHVVDTKNEVTALLFDQEEISTTHEPKTQVDRIPNTLLDDWAVENNNFTEKRVEEPSLGNYVIHETIDFLPNIMKSIDLSLELQNNVVWKLIFDGSRNKIGAKGGCMLISPTNERYYASFKFTFSCTNNVV